MRTLVIAGDYPWPEDRGPRMRLAMVLRGLRRCGPVELCSVVSRFRADFAPPDPALGLAQVARVGFDNRPETGAGLLATLVRPSMPLAMPWRDRSAVQRALARFMSGRYDLVWVFGARPWVLCGQQVFAPTILDLDDLEDQKILARLSVPRPGSSGLPERLRRTGTALVAHEEIRRWRRLHVRAARQVSAIVVCSTLDADRVDLGGTARVAVVPNGYRLVGPPVGRPHRRNSSHGALPGSVELPTERRCGPGSGPRGRARLAGAGTRRTDPPGGGARPRRGGAARAPRRRRGRSGPRHRD